MKDKNVDATCRLIETDRQVTYHEIHASLGIGMSQIQSNLHKPFGYEKLCSRWIPHNLSEAQNRTRHLLQCHTRRFKEGCQIWCQTCPTWRLVTFLFAKLRTNYADNDFHHQKRLSKCTRCLGFGHTKRHLQKEALQLCGSFHEWEKYRQATRKPYVGGDRDSQLLGDTEAMILVTGSLKLGIVSVSPCPLRPISHEDTTRGKAVVGVLLASKCTLIRGINTIPGVEAYNKGAKSFHFGGLNLEDLKVLKETPQKKAPYKNAAQSECNT
ncbi:hypothetical protein EVAR_33355_1 [Eumeta japonica]|uniref:Histone-lysine N-methyltransferase SETMAR n=1 Tax=Eumeta variegata TaxID=151549 RepID=A0A4C1YNS7_EUMVA|nr:hypothetical protein EVAR_33355_1 [Eumeta japonica]